MRIVAFAAAVCLLLLSPVAYADDLATSGVESSRFFAGVWERISAIPMLLVEKVTTGTSTDGDDPDDPPPPQNEAGPMIIVHG